jgi:chromosome segregation ATPase
LQAAQDCAKAQKAEMAGVNNSSAKLREQIGSLEKEREMLKGQIGQGAAKVKDLEGQLLAARAKLAKLDDKTTTDALLKQRDEAVARADKDEDRIRELTLQLHRAGIWP